MTFRKGHIKLFSSLKRKVLSSKCSSNDKLAKLTNIFEELANWQIYFVQLLHWMRSPITYEKARDKDFTYHAHSACVYSQHYSSYDCSHSTCNDEFWQSHKRYHHVLSSCGIWILLNSSLGSRTVGRWSFLSCGLLGVHSNCIWWLAADKCHKLYIYFPYLDETVAYVPWVKLCYQRTCHKIDTDSSLSFLSSNFGHGISFWK